MAKVTITIEDKPGGEEVAVHVDSEPAFPEKPEVGSHLKVMTMAQQVACTMIASLNKRPA